jgi:CRP/FNR family transcriptional regulator, cyclic AMP receptor protein
MISIETIRSLRSFREYTDRELEILLGATLEVHFEAGENLSEEGTPAESCFYIVSGEVDVVRAYPEGERVIAQQTFDHIVGHLALVSRGRRTATLRAATSVVALEFTREVFDALLEASSTFAIRFQEHIAVLGIRQLRRSTARLVEVLTATAEATPGEMSAETRDALRYLGAATGEWSLPVPRVHKE